jgi:DNA topoisomerase-2
MLNPLTRFIFPEADDSILNYLNDDGTLVEPEFYVPIIPFALMNGISGIGTGFSCSIPAFSPNQIIDYLRFKLRGENPSSVGEFIPYYEGFKGTIEKVDNNKYLTKGVYEKIDNDKIRISELPIGTWTMPYISYLEGLADGTTDKNGKKIYPSIRDFTSMSTEVNIDISITFPRGKLAELEEKVDPATHLNGVQKLLKLTSSVSSTNMHMFDKDCKLRKYGSVEQIIDDFYDVRLSTYSKRKKQMIIDLEKLLVKLSNRARYILATLDGSVDLRKKNAQLVKELMTSKGFDLIDGNFNYLIKMPMDSVTEENVEKILKEKTDAENELNKLKKTTLETMWLSELETLQNEYKKYKVTRENIQKGASTNNVKKVKKRVTKK